MKKFSAIILIVTILTTLIIVPAMANKTVYLAGDFSDIENHWAYDQMSELIAMGILKGYSKTVYDKDSRQYIQVQVAKPYQQITRAEFATILYQTLNLKPEGQASFKDDIPNWADEAVGTLSNLGIIKGFQDGSFKPSKNISRAEIATMLVQALNDKSKKSGKYFSDVPSKDRHWAYDSIQKASAMGIVSGLPNGNFAPDRSAERGEVMVMLYQFMVNDKSQAPSDSSLLSRTDEMLKLMEARINGGAPIDLTPVAKYLTGEQELILADAENLLNNDLNQQGTVNYKVSYPGTVVKKSDRWADIVYETTSSFKSAKDDFEQSLNLKEHFYMIKIANQWYIYSNNSEY